MIYIREQKSTERFPDQFKRFGDEVYERKLAQAFEFNSYDIHAVPTLTQAALHKWQETPLGEFVTTYGEDTFFLREEMIEKPLSYKMAIVTYMTPKRWTEFHLKFNNASTASQKLY